MAFPKVNRTGMSVPTGPTGTLQSGGRGKARAGGAKTTTKKSGLTCSPSKYGKAMK